MITHGICALEFWNFGMNEGLKTPFQVSFFWKTGPHWKTPSLNAQGALQHTHNVGPPSDVCWFRFAP